MIVVNDLCGDESAGVFEAEYLKQLLQNNIYSALLNTKPISFDQVIEATQEQYKKILIDVWPAPDYDPQVRCTLKEDGKIGVTFFAPQWIADRINEDDL